MMPDQNPYKLRKQWEKEDRRDRYKVAAGLMEFLGVVLGVVSILILLGLIVSLLSWLNKDISGTFAILRTHFQ